MKRWELVVVLALGLVLGGCPESWQRPAKRPTSALWVGASSTGLEASEMARLEAAGIAELVVTVGKLDLSSPEGPIIRRKASAEVAETEDGEPGGEVVGAETGRAGPVLPPSVPVTLAVDGSWQGGVGDPAEAAARVAAAASQLRFEFEGRGNIPVGLHFDLQSVDSYESYAAFLSELRDQLDKTLFLSVSLRRDWLGDPGLAEVAEAVDFLVPFLYGQRVEEPEDGSAWDFIELERKLRVLEEIGTPYMLGVIVLGTAAHLSKSSELKARRTGVSLQEILWNRDLKLRPGFSLEGVNRRVYAVVAEKKTRVGKWQVASGEGIRVVRAATSDIEELMRLLGAWELPNHLGQIYYRLPSAEERLSLSMDNLVNALDSTPASPDLMLDATLQRRTGRGWLLRFSITNLNGEITELSLMDSNYLQARALNGVFGQRIRPGDFYRFDLYRVGDDGELVRTFRRSDVVKLHIPILEGQQKVVSGDVEIHVRGEPQLELSGSFLLPDGRNLTVGPLAWPPADDDSEE